MSRWEQTQGETGQVETEGEAGAQQLQAQEHQGVLATPAVRKRQEGPSLEMAEGAALPTPSFGHLGSRLLENKFKPPVCGAFCSSPRVLTIPGREAPAGTSPLAVKRDNHAAT